MLNTPNVLSQLPLGILRQYFKNPLSRPLLVTLFWIMSWIRLHGKANFIHFLIAVRLRSLVIKKETTQSTAKQTITSSSELFQGIHFRGLIAFTRFSTTLCIIVIWKKWACRSSNSYCYLHTPIFDPKGGLINPNCNLQTWSFPWMR